MSRIKRPSPALVVAIMALVAAIVVPAYAALTKGEKKTVKKLANAQITKRAPGLSVASANNANTANSASTADSADTAGDADTLDGLDASAFTPADQIHNSGRVVVNDGTPGDGLPTFVFSVFTVGPFTVQASCAENFNGTTEDHGNLFLLVDATGVSFSGTRSDGVDLNTVSSTSAAVAGVISSANEVKAGHIVAVAPNGQVVSISGSVEVNDPAGDCVFGVTAIGP